MKIDNGFQGIKIDISKYKKEEKTNKTTQWQELALKIIQELRIPKEEQSFIFKVCKQYPFPFVEHCFNETKELAKGDKAGHYFVKLVYKK